mmetsp:Transcript_54930/g.131626  ORF Transcript_54930/g.131626 Transcript_54930/m.131626 type:complete len:240 (+) Transcript_54930:210-929(+)
MAPGPSGASGSPQALAATSASRSRCTCASAAFSSALRVSTTCSSVAFSSSPVIHSPMAASSVSSTPRSAADSGSRLMRRRWRSSVRSSRLGGSLGRRPMRVCASEVAAASASAALRSVIASRHTYVCTVASGSAGKGSCCSCATPCSTPAARACRKERTSAWRHSSAPLPSGRQSSSRGGWHHSGSSGAAAPSSMAASVSPARSSLSTSSTRWSEPRRTSNLLPSWSTECSSPVSRSKK